MYFWGYMANIDILKDFEEIEFVRDSAVCTVIANEFILNEEVVPYLEFEVNDNNLPANAGMKIGANGVEIAWCGEKYFQSIADMQDDYYVLIGDVPTSTLYSSYVLAARMVKAFKNHPNYALFSEFAYVEYLGGEVFCIKARNSDVVLKKYTSFDDNISGGILSTYVLPNNSFIVEMIEGNVNSTFNPHEITGTNLSFRPDFKLIVDVMVYNGSNAVVVTENYYPDNDAKASIDVAGIVNRYFRKENKNFNFTYNHNSLIKVEVKISSFFDDNKQSYTFLNFNALNAYTGESAKNHHVSLIKKYFDNDVHFLTALPERVKIQAAYGIILQTILRRQVNINGTTTTVDGWGNNSKLFIQVVYKNAVFPVQQIYVNLDMEFEMEHKCRRFFITKNFLSPYLNNDYEDIEAINVSVYNGGIGFMGKTLILDHKHTGDEVRLLFKNRFGVYEQLIARESITEKIEIEKQTALINKPWNGGADVGDTLVYGNRSENGGTIQIGYLGKEYKGYLEDFLNSNEVFILKKQEWVAIRIVAGDYDLENSLENMSSLEVDYMYSSELRS